MAQYYQVLSQGEKNTVEELRQYYPNIIENQTVQYVINPEDQQQQFQGQQILVSSDQLMVIENQGHVIVDQSAVTYQNPQYVLQDNTVEYQDRPQQQVYYMEEVDGDRQVQVEQQIQSPQPIVLNHQLQTPIRNQLTVPQKTVMPVRQIQQIQQQTRQVQTQSPVRQVLQQRTPNQQAQPQLVQQRNIVAQQQARQPAQVQQTTQIQQQAHVPQQVQTTLQQLPLQTEADTQQAVALSDGRIMVLADYKQLLAESKQRNSAAAASPAVQQERMEVPALVKYGTPPTEQGQKPKPSRSNNRTRSRRTANNPSRGNANSNSLQYSLQDNQTALQQKQQQLFAAQQQMKLLNQSQQKQCIPQNQFVQQPQRQQLIQQQQPTAIRQHQPQTHQAQQQLQPQQQHHQSIQQPQYVQPHYIIQPPSQHQQHPQCPLPPYVASSQIQQIIENTPISEEYSDSIRMLVLLENGEQRLITFTLPKEACTIQEILEQVGVPFHPDTKIECTETSHAGINYLVTVGVQNSEPNSQEETIDSEEGNSQHSSQKADTSTTEQPAVLPKPPTPEPPAEIETPRYIPGLLAVCNHCGYTSENFNRCLRCRYKLPDDVKTRPVLSNSGTNGKKPDVLKVLQATQDKKTSPVKCNVSGSKVTNGATPTKRKKTKVVDPEPVVLTLLSSDEEDESSTNNKLSETDQLIQRLSNSSVTLSAIKKEPSASDIQQNSNLEMESAIAVRGGGKDDSAEGPEMSTTLVCRTIRIGSYRYIPNDNLVIKSKGIVLKVPTPQDQNDIRTIIIEKKHMVKVLVNFQKTLPVVFYYVVPSVGQLVREQLGMTEGSELYFDPLSTEEAYRRITILPENVSEDTKTVFKQIYGKPINIMDELTTKEANDILVKTCPKELSKVMASTSGYNEIKQLLIYPPGKGGLPINTEDYLCLAQDQFLNDVIIDFYLKYLILNLPREQQEKVHVFSTFFYKRLTTKPVKASRRSHPAELDPTLSPAQKRHARVEKWTKSVNLFEKDFIIIPINENCHWFLAIVCFPGIDGCVTLDGKPALIEPRQRRKKITTTIGNVTITTIKQEADEKAISCDEGEASDKDEAEGDDSELDSEGDSEESEPTEPIESIEPPPVERNEKGKRQAIKQPIKQPCVLIFDSLAGASRSRVVATLRDYLTCEYKAKMGAEKIFNKDVIKGSCPKVPQQTNFTDCGLYLLQYVEQFFKDPIQDYRIPIKQVIDWFDEFVVTKKREDISILIKELMAKYGKDPSSLPDVAFPTLNGKLVIHNPEDDDDEFMDDFEEEEDEMPEDGDTSDLFNDSLNSELQLEMEMEPEPDPEPIIAPTTSKIRITLNHSRKEEKLPISDIKLSPESVKQSDDFLEQTVPNASLLKPNVSELQKQSSRDTLSYLKAKRINRHKHTDAVDVKKFKHSSD